MAEALADQPSRHFQARRLTPKRQKLLAADPPPDAIFNQSDIKINQQSDLVTSKLQISRQLGFMNRLNNLADNQIMLQRGFNHLGVFALNANRASARNNNKKHEWAVKAQRSKPPDRAR
jgi:hypothetical protein